MTERVQDKHVIAVWMDAGLSRKRAASRLGITVNMLTKRARKLDLPMREQGKKKFPDKQIRLVWGDASLTRKQAAGTVGMSVRGGLCGPLFSRESRWERQQKLDAAIDCQSRI